MTTPAPHIAAVDWSQPWLAPYRERGRAIERDLGHGLGVADALNRQLDLSPIALAHGALRFIEPDGAATGEAYESFIARTSQVPTRDNLHDLFNGLVWLAFPHLKRQLNALHARQIGIEGIGPQRGAVRDRLTLFDENGALWQAPPPLVDALRRRDWQALFVTRRDDWQQAQLTIVGHALLEKLATAPRKAITAHVWVVPESQTLQTRAMAALDAEALGATPAPLPLPVLGTPGWWPANESDGFYDDPGVFRPARARPGPT